MGDYLHPYNVFDFTMSRKRDGPKQFLKRYRGFLQADAFTGYDCVYAGGNVVEVGCNAHARRKLIEAGPTEPAGSAAGLAFYRELYAIERAIKEELDKLPPESDEPTRTALRLRIRQERAVPVWEAFGKWLGVQKAEALPKSPFGAALTYLKNNWEALKLYTTSGYLSIDNNVAEQHMKTIATGRKNWLFTGSEKGGKTMAVLFTLVSSCQRHGHDPFVYLRDVLERLPNHPADRLAELLPDQWTPPKSADPPAVEDGAKP
jgi:hypothetical protein